MNIIPESFQTLLNDETRACVYLTTLMPDNSPQVTQDPNNPYRFLQLHGLMIDIPEEGANTNIDTLAGKYTGIFIYKHHKSREKRVIYKILPLRVEAYG